MIRFVLFVAALFAALAIVGIQAVAQAVDDTPVVVEVDRLVQGKPVDWWARRAVQARKDANARKRTIRRLRRAIRHDPAVVEAINLAVVTYGVSGVTLARKGVSARRAAR